MIKNKTGLFRLFFKNESSKVICQQYYGIYGPGISFNKNVSDVAIEHGFKSHELLGFVRENCSLYLTVDKCPQCNRFRSIDSRSKFIQVIEELDSLEKAMGINSAKNLVEYYKGVLCKECIEENEAYTRARKKEEKQQRLNEFVQRAVSFIDIDDITLREAVSIVAIMRIGAREDYKTIPPINRFIKPLAPTDDFEYEIIDEMLSRDWLLISPKNDANQFSFKENGSVSFDGRNIEYFQNFAANTPDAIKKIKEIESVMNSGNFPDSWLYEIDGFWKEIAYHEMLNYISICLGSHDIPFEPREKTEKIINSILESYSVSEGYAAVWKIAKDTAAWKARTPAPASRSTDYFLTAIEGYVDKCKSRGWNLYSYNRWDDISGVSEIFYNLILKEDGFRKVPNY